MNKRMRTANPFCSATELAVLRALVKHKDQGATSIAVLIRMSSATFYHALASLERRHIVHRLSRAHYEVTPKGKLLVKTAGRLEKMHEGRDE
jgi:predicted transcriptional regulator